MPEGDDDFGASFDDLLENRFILGFPMTWQNKSRGSLSESA